jgi:hypothetical protein
MDYYLDFWGLRTVLRTPGEITLSPKLNAFLCEPHTEWDCLITVQSVAALPPMAEQGIWHGAEYYDSHLDAMRIFYCDTANGTPYAVTTIFGTGEVDISVLPEYLSSFSGSSGIFNRISMETLLLQHRGLLLHASLIEYGGKAIAFTGPSGVGKSTQADLWKAHYAAQVINGDRAALRMETDGWFAYGSPYAGTSGIYKNERAPLAAIILLEQANENQLQPLTEAEAFRMIYPEVTMHRWDRTFVERATDLYLQLLQQVPVYRLACLPTESAAQLVKKGLGL